MNKRISKAGLIGLVLSLVGACISPMYAQAATARHSIVQVEAFANGKSVGPLQATGWAKATVTGWSSTYDCAKKKTFYSANLKITQSANPMIQSPGLPTTGASAVKTVQRSLCPLAAPLGGQRSSTQPMKSWWNPLSWDWGSIMGSVWNTIFKNCASGAASGVVGTASGTTIVNLLVRGGKLFVGVEGYAAIAIGSCIVGISF